MDLISIFDITSNTLGFLALVCAMGALISRFFVFPISLFALDDSIMRAWIIFFITSLAVITLSTFSLLLIRSIEMNNANNYPIGSLLWLVLSQTHFGFIQLVRICTLSILWVTTFFIFANRSQRVNIFYAILFLSMLIIIWTTSAVSHAADQGDFTLRIGVDWIHIFSAAAWVGSIITTVVILGLFYTTLLNRPDIFIDLINRLSWVSATAVLFVILSGSYNAFWLLGRFDALLKTPAGIILTSKLCFISALILIGAFNRFLLLPRINAWTATKKLTSATYLIKVTLTIDVLIIVIILLLAALLIHTMPPMLM